MKRRAWVFGVLCLAYVCFVAVLGVRRQRQDLKLEISDFKESAQSAAIEDEAIMDAVEFAWVVIANAGGGNWKLETEDWQDAARRFHAMDGMALTFKLIAAAATPAPKEGE